MTSLSYDSKKSASTKRHGPVSIGKISSNITAPVLKTKATGLSSLVAEWATVVGPELSSFTMPNKLSGGTSLDKSSKAPGHLVLKVDPLRALEVQYKIPQLIERVNSALGYKAIASIRLVQTPISKQLKKPIVQLLEAKTAMQPSSPPGSRLEQALLRMKQGVANRIAS